MQAYSHLKVFYLSGATHLSLQCPFAAHYISSRQSCLLAGNEMNITVPFLVNILPHECLSFSECSFVFDIPANLDIIENLIVDGSMSLVWQFHYIEYRYPGSI